MATETQKNYIVGAVVLIAGIAIAYVMTRPDKKAKVADKKEPTPAVPDNRTFVEKMDDLKSQFSKLQKKFDDIKYNGNYWLNPNKSEIQSDYASIKENTEKTVKKLKEGEDALKGMKVGEGWTAEEIKAFSDFIAEGKKTVDKILLEKDKYEFTAKTAGFQLA